MKRIRNYISYCVLFLLIIILGFAALLLVYQIPTEGQMRTNLEISIPIIEEEGDHPTWAGMKDGHAHYMGTVAENFTDVIMLSMADYSGKESSLNEMLLARYYQANDDVADALHVTAEDGETVREDVQLLSYGRFWNGYMVWLKPLLYFTDYGTIRMMGVILCLAAAAALCVCTQSRLGTPYTVGIVITLAILNPVTISTCISYWDDYLIMVLASVLLMHFYPSLKEKKRTGLLFALTGGLCAYFCWLFYPLITVGIPLALYCVLEIRDSHERGKKVSALRLTFQTVKYGIIWAIFYIGVWTSKWILATIMTGTNVLLDAENQVALRTSTTHENGMKLTAFHTIYNNVAVLVKAPYIILFAMCLLWLIIYFLRKKNLASSTARPGKMAISNREESYPALIQKEGLTGIPFLLIAAIPFVWYALTVNHSYIHVIIVYRDLAVAVFALWCWLVEIFGVV